jgi:hypothetical protein
MKQEIEIFSKQQNDKKGKSIIIIYIYIYIYIYFTLRIVVLRKGIFF